MRGRAEWGRAALAAVLLLAGALPAAADYQVRGRFLYRDREFGLEGFTGNQPDLPIRRADVQVLDAGTQQLLSSGATDLQGNFSLPVVDGQTRDIKVRVLSSSTQTPGLNLQVKTRDDVAGAIYSVSAPVYAAHPPTLDVVLAPVVALPGQGGEAFNIFDVVLDGLDFIASLRGGVRPSQMLTLYWESGATKGTYYLDPSHSIYLVGESSDSDGYDDTVILHELGHFTEFTLAASNNFGGHHSLDGLYDLSLTWSEGFATFFACMVRDWKGCQRPDIYVDTTGQPGTPIISYEVETPSLGRLGADNEVTVTAVLWDVYDRPSTLDGSPGVDDDPLDLPNGAALFWKDFTGYLPTATSISLEDFWDGWFSPAIDNGYLDEMRRTFAARGVEYFPDSFEPDGSAAEAHSITPGDSVTHHTIYGRGDTDWARLDVTVGGTYIFETRGLLSGADTKLDLLWSDGQAVLATNDDRTYGDASSYIGWTALYTGFVYLRCQRKLDQHTYGSYDLVVKGAISFVNGAEAVTTPAGIEMRWRARLAGGFRSFDVERGGAAIGPFTKINAMPIPGPVAGDSAYAFIDSNVEPGRHYFYRIEGFQTSGGSLQFGPYEGVAAAPARLALHPAYPNPFNPGTSLRVDLPSAARVWLRLYSPSGRLVCTLVPGEVLPAGSTTRPWNGRDDGGVALPSGIYFVKLDALGQERTQRIALVR